jgi:hypothetical protein
MFIIQLDRCFVDFELMNTLGIIYPQFWMQLDVGFSFSLHIDDIKKHYCELKKMKPSLVQVAEPWNVNMLNL